MKGVGRWFWTPIREGENWAQTLVRVAGNIFRSVSTLVFGVAIAVAATAYVNDKADRQREGERQSVFVEAKLPTSEQENGCAPEFPLFLKVTNGSSDTLMSMDIRLTAREPGRSTDVLVYPQNTKHWDNIVPPKHILGLCYSFDQRVDVGSVLSAEPERYSIVFRKTEPWMLKETKAYDQDNPFAKYGP